MASGSQGPSSEHLVSTALLCGKGITLVIALNYGFCPRVIQMFLCLAESHQSFHSSLLKDRQQGLGISCRLVSKPLSIPGAWLNPSECTQTCGLSPQAAVAVGLGVP